MGGPGATTTVIQQVKKTEADVKKDMFNQVLKNAREQLKTGTGKDLPANAELDEIMRGLAEWKFKDEFGFPFEKDPSKYSLKDAIPNSEIFNVGQLCSIDAKSNIDQFFDVVLLSNADLPDWSKKNAKYALKTLAGKLVSQDTMLRVRFENYLQSFDGTKITEGSRAGNFSDSWKAKAVVSFITGSFREDDITAGITIIYFLGLYYKTDSPTKAVRNSIEQTAFKGAIPFTKYAYNVATWNDLEKALKFHVDNTYKERFGFDYKAPAPPDMVDGSQTLSHHKLFLFQDSENRNIQQAVDTDLFSGIDISPYQNEFKERALSEVTKQFTSALSNPQTGAWKEVTINRTFAAANFRLNTMQMNALIFYYFDEKVADLHSVGDAKNQIVVSNTYIFAFVFLWEVTSPNKQLEDSLEKTMIAKIPNYVSSSGNPDMEDELEKFAKKEFRKHFGFDYEGTVTKPVDKGWKDGRDIYPRNQLMDNYYSATLATDSSSNVPRDDRITGWLDKYILTREKKPHAKQLPKYARESIYDDLKGDIKYCLQNAREGNRWDAYSVERVYLSKNVGKKQKGGKSGGKPPVGGGKPPVGDGKPPVDGDGVASDERDSGQAIKLSTTYVYALGEISVRGVKKQIDFFYLLLIARAVDKKYLSRTY